MEADWMGGRGRGETAVTELVNGSGQGLDG